MIWKKPPGGDLPNKRAPFVRATFFADGTSGALFAPTHLQATPSADWISETSI